MSLVDTNWLEENLDKVKIIDCSWHMPQANRNGREEYNKEHIPNAIFFDLDKNSKIDTDLPHMLTDISSWEKIMEDMGIENKDEIVVYDNSDVISSCRCWYNLIYFGHDPKLVHVLDGGFKKWKKENKTTNNKEVITKNSVYSCKENAELVKNKKQIEVIDPATEKSCAAISLGGKEDVHSAVIAAKNAYHGNTMGALSLMDYQERKQPFLPLLPDIKHITFNCEFCLNQITEKTAAVILETRF